MIDVLAVEGRAVTSHLGPAGAARGTPTIEVRGMRLVTTFEDGDALFAADAIVVERGGVEAGARPYRPGERLWVKAKNRAAARFAEERAGIGKGVTHG